MCFKVTHYRPKLPDETAIVVAKTAAEAIHLFKSARNNGAPVARFAYTSVSGKPENAHAQTADGLVGWYAERIEQP